MINKEIIILIRDLVILIGLLFCKQTQAEPLLLTNSSSLTSETLYFVANCQKKPDHPRSLLISSSHSILTDNQQKTDIIDWVYQDRKISKHLKFLEGYSNFKEKYQSHSPMLFCLTTARNAQGIWEPSVLSGTKAESGKIQDTYLIETGYTKGYLTLSKVYYQQAWHEILLLSLAGNHAKNDIIHIFDVAENNQLKPSFTLKLSDFKLNFKPLCFRLVDTKWVIALAGMLKGKGTIIFISLEDFSEKICLEAGSHSIISVEGVDSESKGWVENVYAEDDKGQIWKFEVNKLTTSDKQIKHTLKLDGKLIGTVEGAQSTTNSGY